MLSGVTQNLGWAHRSGALWTHSPLEKLYQALEEQNHLYIPMVELGCVFDHSYTFPPFSFPFPLVSHGQSMFLVKNLSGGIQYPKNRCRTEYGRAYVPRAKILCYTPVFIRGHGQGERDVIRGNAKVGGGHIAPVRCGLALR